MSGVCQEKNYKKSQLIYEKLKSLEPHEAMTQDQILDWLLDEHKIIIDPATLKQHIKNIREAGYNLPNKPKTGYYIR